MPPDKLICIHGLRRGTKVIATIDIVVSVLSFLTIFFLIVLTIAYGDRLEETVEKDRNAYPELAAILSLGKPFVMIMLLFMVVFICYFYLGRYLLYGAKERSYMKVQRWCTITLVIIILRIIFFITAVYFSPDRMFVSSFGVIGFLYQIFCLWIVRSYAEKLRITKTQHVAYAYADHSANGHIFPSCEHETSNREKI